MPLELPAYQRKENWGAAETFYQLVRALAGPTAPPPGSQAAGAPAGRRAALQYAGPDGARLPPSRRCRRRSPACWTGSASTSMSSAPLGATPADLARLGDADFNVVLYPEIAGQAAHWLQRTFGQPIDQDRSDRRVGATREFIAEVAELAGVDPAAVAARHARRGCPGIRARSIRPI